MPVTVHVRIGRLRVARKSIEIVLVAKIGQHNRAYNIDYHRQHSQPAVISDHLGKNRQGSNHGKRYTKFNNEPNEILRQLKLRMTLEKLDDHRRYKADPEKTDENNAHSQKLGKNKHPVGRRRRINNVRELNITLLPHQLGRIVDHDDHRDNREGSRDRVDHHGGERIDRRTEQKPEIKQRTDGIEHTKGKQNPESDTLYDSPDFERNPGPKLLPFDPAPH